MVTRAETTFASSLGSSLIDTLQRKLEYPYKNWLAPSLPPDATLALCQTPSEVTYLHEANHLHIDAFVALTPEAAAQCYLAGREYLKIEDFFDVRLFVDVDEPMLQLQSDWSNQVDAFFQEAMPNARSLGFRPAGLYFFFLKIVSDMLFRTAIGLAHLLLTARPRKLVYFEANSLEQVDDTLFFHAPPYTAILPSCAREYGTAVAALPPIAESGRRIPNLNLRSTLRRILPPSWLHQLRRVRRNGLRRSVASMFLRSSSVNGKDEILCKNGYDLRWVVDLALERGLSVVPIDEAWCGTSCNASRALSEFTQALNDLWPRIVVRPFFTDLFSWCGTNLYSVAETRLRHWWFRVIPAMWRALMQAKSYMESRRPKAVLVPCPWRPEEYSTLQAARLLSIPTFTYQHGGFEGNCEYTAYDMTELRQAEYRLVYGKGAATYLQERASRSQEKLAEILPVGSARLDAIRSAPDSRDEIRGTLQVRPREPLVLYIPTSYQYNWYATCQSYLSVPYFELLTQVATIMGEFPHLHFVYKPFPDAVPDPIAEIIAKRCPNCHVVQDIAVPALMQASDACIIDIPSTALLEALLTPKPLLVFADSRCIRLRPEARPLLESRAVLTETQEDFLKQLRLFLKKGRFAELECPDDRFLTTYGTYRNDGQAAMRVLAAVEEIIQQHAGLANHAVS